MFFPVAGLDMYFHDTYFVVAHFHYVFVGGVVFGLFSAFYYWYPKWTGRKMNEKLGLIHFLTSFISYNATFWPMHNLGIMGMPRRTHSYTIESGYGELNSSITIWAFIFGLSQLIMIWNMIYSQKRGDPAGPDPWGGWSLEWSTTSPPPTPSFAEIPIQKDANTEAHRDGAFIRGVKKMWMIGEKEAKE
jgi:cytochrome c oxidase subunit 1